MDKLNQISDKLIELGYQKQIINKPKTLEEFINNDPIGETKLLDSITQYVGDADKAKELMNAHNRMIYESIPNISFTSNKFDMDFYLDDEYINITTSGKPSKLNCNVEISEVIPFKKISIDDFYGLLIEKNYPIELILNNTDN